MPLAPPETIPVEPTLAMELFVLLQFPPVDVSPNVIVLPAQTLRAPVNEDGVPGNGLTVTVAFTVPQVKA